MVNRLADNVGIMSSTLCIIHCVGTLAFALLLPAGVFAFFLDENIHVILSLVVLSAGIFAFVPGYRLHKNKKIIFLALIGILAIITPVLLFEVPESMEIGFTLFGGGTLIFSHIRNIFYCKKCNQKPLACLSKNH